eukprot:366303-Chlamydomonas_euryale.AAC.8
MALGAPPPPPPPRHAGRRPRPRRARPCARPRSFGRMSGTELRAELRQSAAGLASPTSVGVREASPAAKVSTGWGPKPPQGCGNGIRVRVRRGVHRLAQPAVGQTGRLGTVRPAARIRGCRRFIKRGSERVVRGPGNARACEIPRIAEALWEMLLLEHQVDARSVRSAAVCRRHLCASGEAGVARVCACTLAFLWGVGGGGGDALLGWPASTQGDAAGPAASTALLPRSLAHAAALQRESARSTHRDDTIENRRFRAEGQRGRAAESCGISNCSGGSLNTDSSGSGSEEKLLSWRPRTAARVRGCRRSSWRCWQPAPRHPARLSTCRALRPSILPR